MAYRRADTVVAKRPTNWLDGATTFLLALTKGVDEATLTVRIAFLASRVSTWAVAQATPCVPSLPLYLMIPWITSSFTSLGDQDSMTSPFDIPLKLLLRARSASFSNNWGSIVVPLVPPVVWRSPAAAAASNCFLASSSTAALRRSRIWSAVRPWTSEGWLTSF